MLKDKVTVTIKTGAGGRGSMAMIMNKVYGGDGGRGGDIFVEGNENMYDLSWYDYGHKYKTERGENGQKRHKTGNEAKDLTLVVPLTTEVYFGQKFQGTIDSHGQRVLVLKGGDAGWGNTSLKNASTNGYFDDKDPRIEGGPGKSKEMRLVLKLQSDVIFVGLPNAGKSTMLNTLTNSTVKIAAYAFTTLDPQLGIMDGAIKLMDLPGLIEGTNEGKGLGTRFLKHTQYARLVAHFVSLENPDPWQAYYDMRKELEKISKNIFNLPEIVILSKSDEKKPEEVKKIEKIFAKKGLTVISSSIIDDNSIAKIRSEFIRMLPAKN
jgi:GTP-binding protein